MAKSKAQLDREIQAYLDAQGPEVTPISPTAAREQTERAITKIATRGFRSHATVKKDAPHRDRCSAGVFGVHHCVYSDAPRPVCYYCGQVPSAKGGNRAHSTIAKAKPRAKKSSSKRGQAKPALRVAYRLQLTPSELSAIDFARGRYSWPDMLSAHVSDGGLVAFTEPEMWQWCDDVDSDAEGGHSPFPLAAGAFAEKLQNFYDERI